MKILDEVKFVAIFLAGCLIMFFAVQSVKAQTYTEYQQELTAWQNCGSEYFSGGADCVKPRFRPCVESEHFSGGSCKPVKINSCAVFDAETMQFFISDIDIVSSTGVTVFERLKLFWDGTSFVVKPD